jgi:hypothetical protein
MQNNLTIICKLYFIKVQKCILFISILSLFASCENGKIKDALIGEYAIDSVYFKDRNILYDFSINHFEIYNNGNVQLPIVYGETRNKDDRNTEGKWTIKKDQNKYILHINSKNEYFNGEYILKFTSNNEKHTLNLYLTSENMNIYCTKSNFNFENRKSFVEDVSEITK